MFTLTLMRFYKLIRFSQPLRMLIVHSGQQFWQSLGQTKRFCPILHLDMQLHYLGLVAQLLEHLSGEWQGFELLQILGNR